MSGDMLQKPNLPDVQIPELLNPEFKRITPILGVDGEEYEVVEFGVAASAHLPGLTAEIGVREGGCSELIMRLGRAAAIHGTGRRTTHVAIDPYGNIPYADRDDRVVPGFGYDEVMRRTTQGALSTLARSLEWDLLFLPFEDEEFMLRFEHGVPIYEGGEKRIENQYRFAHIDGPHTYIAAISAAEFFANRMPVGGVLVFDNINYYDHGKVHEVLSQVHDMELLHVGTSKALHRKVGA